MVKRPAPPDRPDRDEGAAQSADVDHSLIELYRAMTVRERLRAATRHAATLERLRRAASPTPENR